MGTISGRNRSEGWKHAKLDGHLNEASFAAELSNYPSLLASIAEVMFSETPASLPRIEIDGAKQVQSIFGDKTVSKTDITVTWEENSKANISLKKSSSGQAWIVSVSRFVSAVEYHLKATLESQVKQGLALFIGGENIDQYSEMFSEAIKKDSIQRPEIVDQQLHQQRLVATSIKENYPDIWKSTLDFFDDNIALITSLTFR